MPHHMRDFPTKEKLPDAIAIMNLALLVKRVRRARHLLSKRESGEKKQCDKSKHERMSAETTMPWKPYLSSGAPLA